jgi:predicted RND superfamily exporter protein
MNNEEWISFKSQLAASQKRVNELENVVNNYPPPKQPEDPKAVEIIRQLREELETAKAIIETRTTSVSLEEQNYDAGKEVNLPRMIKRIQQERNCAAENFKVTNQAYVKEEKKVRELREELEKVKLSLVAAKVYQSERLTTLTTALAADRKLLYRIATFLTQCDSSSPKVPELIRDIEKRLIAASEKENSNVAPADTSA